MGAYTGILTVALCVFIVMWYGERETKRHYKFLSDENKKDLDFWREYSAKQTKEIKKMKKQLDTFMKWIPTKGVKIK